MTLIMKYEVHLSYAFSYTLEDSDVIYEWNDGYLFLYIKLN